MVLLLLANGADPNIICKDASPLWLACYHGLTELVYPLLDNGADPNCICNGAAALHVAAARGLVDICQILCSFPRGVDVNVWSERLGTAMHVAVSKGHKYVMDCLLEYNPNLSLRNRFGETPLHIACRIQDEAIALQLIKSNLPIDPFIKDTMHGSTVAHVTTSLLVFRALLRRWPHLLHALDDYGRTPTFYMPGAALALLSSITSKVAQHSGEHLLSDVDRYGDIFLVCPVFVSKLPSSTDSTTAKSDQPLSPAEELTSELTNASIAIPTERILCHKAVLYTRSGYLKEQLQSTAAVFEPKASDARPEPTQLSIPSISADVMRAVVHYLYTDTLKCPRNLLSDIVSASKLLRLSRLRELASGKLGKDVQLSEGTLSADLLRMREESCFADILVHLPAGGPTAPEKSFRLHRFVLAAFSEYFQTMFTAGLRESRTGIVELHPIPLFTFDAYLHWVYSFTIKPTVKTLAQCFSLLELSSTFITPDLSLPMQTKVLTLLYSSLWANLDVAILESDRLAAQIVYEQCAIYYNSSATAQALMKKKLPADALERLQKMAAPRLDNPFVSALVQPSSASASGS